MGRYEQAKDKKSTGLVVVIALILIIVAGGGWFYLDNLKQQEGAVSESKTIMLPPPVLDMTKDDFIPDGAAPDDTQAATEVVDAAAQEQPFILPELDGSDGSIRDALLRISPGLATWLNTDQLIRKYLLIANDFSQGLRLQKHMRFLKQAQPFTVEQTDRGMFIAKKSYQRYDKLAAAIDAMDVQSTLAVYKQFRPLLRQVFAEFSYPEEHHVEDIIVKAASKMLAAPVIEGPIALERPSVTYKFANQKLEALNPVSKQMIRMGPQNTRVIQNKIRQLVQELAKVNE